MKIKSNIPKPEIFKVFNGLITPDGTLLVSTYRHDYQIHQDKNGKGYMLDGGLEEYYRSSANGDEIQIDLYSDSPHIELRKYIGRGGYGKDGKGEFRFTPLDKMTDEHLDASIVYVKNNLKEFADLTSVGRVRHLEWNLQLYKKEKQYRNKNNIQINEDTSQSN